MDIEHCRFLIGRFDHYTDGVNSKVNFYIGINTFILGGVCLGYNTVKSCPHDTAFWILFGVSCLLLICCFVSIYYTLKAMAPYLRDNHRNDDIDSLIFFGGIAKHTCAEFENKFGGQDKQGLLTDFVRQTFSLAKGLDMKFRNLNRASVFLFAEYFLLVIVIFLTFLILN